MPRPSDHKMFDEPKDLRIPFEATLIRLVPLPPAAPHSTFLPALNNVDFRCCFFSLSSDVTGRCWKSFSYVDHSALQSSGVGDEHLNQVQILVLLVLEMNGWGRWDLDGFPRQLQGGWLG